jgi:hypothetical protein
MPIADLPLMEERKGKDKSPVFLDEYCRLDIARSTPQRTGKAHVYRPLLL